MREIAIQTAGITLYCLAAGNAQSNLQLVKLSRYRVVLGYAS